MRHRAHCTSLPVFPLLGAAVVALLCSGALRAQSLPGEVLEHQKISALAGGLMAELEHHVEFGSSLTPLGDLDGDGNPDIMVSAPHDGDGGIEGGAVYVLFLDDEGAVATEQKISVLEGGFTGTLLDGDHFGRGLAALGDVDGDGVMDVAVGADLDDDGGPSRGAVWILFLNTDGTVKGHQKISSTTGGLVGPLANNGSFGARIGALSDFDGDSIPDMAVAATRDPDGGPARGAITIITLNSDGTVKSEQKISSTQGGLTATIDDGDLFGSSVESIRDFDGDSIPDIAVGATNDDDGGANRGALYLLYLNADGTVKAHDKISATAGGFTGALDDEDAFGTAVAYLGDLDGDGTRDIAVGADFDDDDDTDRGALYLLFMNADGTVKEQKKISSAEGGIERPHLEDGDRFGSSIIGGMDVNGDGVKDIIVGAPFDTDSAEEPPPGGFLDDKGGESVGAIWVLMLNDSILPYVDGEGGVDGLLGPVELTGAGLTLPGNPVLLHLENALASSPAFLVLSPTHLGAAFKGGVLGPAPDIVIGVATDSNGEIDLGFTWPASAVGSKLFWQYWIPDAAGVFGFAASNTLLTTTTDP